MNIQSTIESDNELFVLNPKNIGQTMKKENIGWTVWPIQWFNLSNTNKIITFGTTSVQ